MQALLGALLVKMERREEAEATLREVIDAAPSFAKPAEDLGYLLLQADRAADALPFLERATHLDPTLERAWFSLGKALALLGRGKEADAAFEKSFELSPERRLMALAAEHQKEGRIEEAERIYRRVLRDNPRNVDALRLLALIAMQGRSAGRRRDAAAARPSRSRRISCWRSSTSAACARNRTASPRRSSASTACIALEPDQPQAHFLRAATLARASFTQEAIEAYRNCLAIRPSPRRRAARARPRPEGRRRLRRRRRLVQRLHARGAGLRRDLLEPRQPQDLPLRRRDGRRNGEARRCAGRQRAVGGQLPVCARQGLRGPRRLRAGLGTTTGAATRRSAPQVTTTRCRPR